MQRGVLPRLPFPLVGCILLFQADANEILIKRGTGALIQQARLAVRSWTRKSTTDHAACSCCYASGPLAPTLGPGSPLSTTTDCLSERATVVEAPARSSSQPAWLCAAGLGTRKLIMLCPLAAPRRARRRPHWVRGSPLSTPADCFEVRYLRDILSSSVAHNFFSFPCANVPCLDL